MNTIQKQINKFLKENSEFDKIRVEGKSIMKGSKLDYKPGDYSMNSAIRKKINQLEKDLGLPVT